MALSDWFSPSSWYKSAVDAGSQAFDAGQALVSSLWAAPEASSPGVQLSDSQIAAIRDAGLTSDLPTWFAAPPSLPERLPTWDEMPWYQKAWSFVASVPGAVGDTAGITQRPGAETPASVVTKAVAGVGGAVKAATSSPSFWLIGIVAGILGIAFLAFMFRRA
jgi:hypothetical protein